MSCLNKDGATFDAKRFVCTHVRTTQPSTLGITSMLILKHAINDKYFFAPKMPVWVEVSTRRPSNQGCAGPLVAIRSDRIPLLPSSLAIDSLRKLRAEEGDLDCSTWDRGFRGA